MEGTSFFKYRPGKTFLHSIPSWIKIILMLILAIAAFYTPLIPALVLWLILIAFSFFILRFSFREILSDLSPTLIYASMLYIASLIINISQASNFSAKVLIPGKQNMELFSHMALSIEISSIFYRTTSPMSFRQGFSQIEGSLRRSDRTPLADALSLTISFIPGLAAFWHRADNAWKARCGKKGIKRILVLTPLLFRTGMRNAYQKSLALQNREK